MKPVRKVIVVGLDGLEPALVDALLEAGRLPNLARLRQQGGYARVATTYPAQTPVAWASFATGTNPGGHGIFDFIRRNPQTYLPDLAFTRYEQKNVFTVPKAVNLRRGTPVWKLLTAAGVPSVVVRCPGTFPPDEVRGRMLAGMGVPDLRGGFGTATFFSTAEVQAGESENVVRLPKAATGPIKTQLPGPRNPKSGEPVTFELALEPKPAAGSLVIRSAGQPATLEVRSGKWSDWLRVKFKLGLLQSVRGMVRFFLPRLEPLELYASPVNFDPEAPLFPISSPPDYAREWLKVLGPYYTTGMVEDHGGLNNERFDEAAYLDQCGDVWRQREQMMLHELGRLSEGFFFILFDTPDRVQHMFWRFQEEDHPALKGKGAGEYRRVIEDHYLACDAVVGKALAHADEQTLLIALSDHGFTSFRRGVHLNSWLHDQGLLALQAGTKPGPETGDFFRHVDWSKTKAYALGLSGIYLNVQGREAKGTVPPAEAEALAAQVAEKLTGLQDTERGQTAVRGVATRRQVYNGPFAGESPDLVVNFAKGYRVSWGTALGGVPAGHFEDNVKKWSGDHIVDPALVPGVLFTNRPFDGTAARLIDLAPTVLAALGVHKGPAMEGRSLLL